MEQLAILLIDFFEKVSKIEAIRDHYVLHSSQLVLIRNAYECKYQIKMIPFEQNSFSKATRLVHDNQRSTDSEQPYSTEDQKIDEELENFLFDHCLNVQEQMYPLVRFWQHLFRHDVQSHEKVNADALKEFELLFKLTKYRSRIFQLQNLNRTLLILTVMDDFFGVDVAQTLAKSDDRRLERIKQQLKQSTGSLPLMCSSSSGQLR